MSVDFETPSITKNILFAAEGLHFWIHFPCNLIWFIYYITSHRQEQRLLFATFMCLLFKQWHSTLWLIVKALINPPIFYKFRNIHWFYPLQIICWWRVYSPDYYSFYFCFLLRAKYLFILRAKWLFIKAKYILPVVKQIFFPLDYSIVSKMWASFPSRQSIYSTIFQALR